MQRINRDIELKRLRKKEQIIINSIITHTVECGMEKLEEMQWRVVWVTVKLKGHVYITVIRRAPLYHAETWTTTRGQEARLEVNEMRMLRWMRGVTRRDTIRI